MPFSFPPTSSLALAGLILEVVNAASIAFRTNLISLIAQTTRNQLSMLVDRTTSMAFLASNLEINWGNVAVIRIEPLRLCCKPISPTLVSIIKWIFSPIWVLIRVLSKSLILILSKPLVLLAPLASLLSLIVLLPPLVSLLSLLSLLLSPLTRLVLASPLVRLSVIVCSEWVRDIGLSIIVGSPLVWLVGLILSSPLVGLIGLIWLILSPLVRLCVIVTSPLIGLVVSPLSLTLVGSRLLIPHFVCKIGLQNLL